ncbi:MAG: HAMP domain-containing histidine kinase [Chloroflexi bacterium]|jgi:signal transduction histidine kinase|nr:HAMP domain-containing histidine kinase [Chloroflexota bacterium]
MLLARALDILAADSPAEQQLADLLGLVARVAGARRAAILADLDRRHAAVAIGRREDAEQGRALARWLDAHAPQTRAERAASAPASMTVVRTRTASAGAPLPRVTQQPPVRPVPASAGPAYVVVEVPGVDHVHLGFELAAPVAPDELAARFPGTLARHAMVALALVTTRIAEEDELAVLRAREDERTRFVSTVAHELRTPLTGLGGYLDLLLDGQVRDETTAREFLERGRSIVGSMAELVGDLLELARLETGALRLATAPFSLAEACGHVLDALAPIAAGGGARLRRDLPPRIRTACADRRRVEQVLTNLVANALKFAPGGTVELEAWFEDSVALAVVRDDGSGIAAEDRERVFAPFVRLDGHERVAGTGLGLPISRDLARAMGGDLGLASVAGSGSSFVLVLPAVAAPAAELVAAALARAVEAEEQELEERAVLRAIRPDDRAVRRGAIPA